MGFIIVTVNIIVVIIERIYRPLAQLVSCIAMSEFYIATVTSCIVQNN